MSNKNYEYQLNLPLGTEFVKKMTDLIDKLENINNNNLSVKIDLSAYMTSLEIVRDFQKKLVSGQNIKTINGQKVLGSGNIEIDTGVNPNVIGNLSDLATSTKTNIVSAINEIDKLISDIEKDYANTSYVNEKVAEINSKITSLTTQINTLSTSINTVKSDLNGVKNRVTTIENAYVKNVTYQDGTGIFTFTMQDGTTKKFDLAIEKVVANFEYDTENNSLILTLADGTQQIVPITALVGDYDGVDGDVIKVDVSGDNLISAELKGKTINETYLSDDVINKINQGVEAKTKVDDVDERLTVVENEYVKSVNIDEDGKLTVTLQDGSQKTIEVSSGTGVKGFEVIEKMAEIVPATASVSGLGNESPTSQVYTKDTDFPTSFEEVTDELGNIFVKIPTMYRKVDSVVDGQITAFTMSTTKIDDTYEPYSVFVKPNGEVMSYVLIGKYANNSSTSMQSVFNNLESNITIGNARTYARNLGTGYQIYDWQFQKLFVDLALLVSQKVNFQDGSVAIREYLGIRNINIGYWIDGVVKDGSTWNVCYDPTKYVDSATSSTDGYVAASYTAPTSDANITKLGYDENNSFFNYPNTVASNSSYNTYYCDGYWSSSGNHPVVSLVGAAYVTNGLWRCSVNNNWSHNNAARLCYRPIETKYTDIRLTLEDDTTFDIPLSDIVPDSYTKEEADSTFATKNELSTTNSNVSGLDTRTTAIENSYLKSVTYDNDTGIFVFTKQDGSVQTFDLAIEKVVVNFEYVEEKITDLTGATIIWNDSAFYTDINKKFNINYNYINPYDGSVVNREGLTFSNSSARFTIYAPDASGLTFYYYDYEDNTYNFNETVASKTWNIVNGDDASNSELCAFIQENATIEGGTKSSAGLQLTLADGTTQFVSLSSFISDSYTKEEANLIFASKDYAYNKAESDENYAKSSDFNVLNNNFKTVQTNVTTLQTEVSTLQTNVAQNQEQVGALNEKSTDHENRIISLEQNQGSGGSTSSVSAFITESVVVSEFSALETAQGAYTHSATVTLTNSLDTMTSIELVNNDPVLFSTYGFAIASASGTSVVVYSIGKPSEDVTLTFEMHETVEVWDGSYTEGTTKSFEIWNALSNDLSSTYEYKEGMTWQEFIDSEYSAGNFSISNDNSEVYYTGLNVYTNQSDASMADSSARIKPTDIISQDKYWLCVSSGGGSGN